MDYLIREILEERMGFSNLEERWIERTDRFACYFPSSNKGRAINDS